MTEVSNNPKSVSMQAPCLFSQSKDLLREEFQNAGLLNEKGIPRLNRAIGYFCNDDQDIGLLVDLFSYWRDEPEYMVLRRYEKRSFSWHHKAVKCSKRGNDVYVARTRKRFRFLEGMSQDHKFFKPKDFDTKTDVRSSILWFTLTYDTKRCSRREAWENIGKEWNCFITAMRRRYGKINVMRSWEAFENGYPHIHAILWFEETSFQVFPWLEGLEPNEQKESVSSEGTLADRDRLNEDTMLPPLAKQSSTSERVRYSYRIADKAQFEALWHSWIDTTAISSMKKATNYVSKYQMKVVQGRESSGSEGKQTTLDQHQKGAKTLAFMWLFRKKSFSVSGSFSQLVSDLIRSMHFSNMERQIDLLGNVVDEGKWEFVGIFSGRELEINPYIWGCQLDPAQVRVVHGVDGSE